MAQRTWVGATRSAGNEMDEIAFCRDIGTKKAEMLPAMAEYYARNTECRSNVSNPCIQGNYAGGFLNMTK